MDGDFHSAFAGGDIEGRLSGLIDINHRTNHQFVRHPISPDDPANLPGPATNYQGPRAANVPDISNTQFYPDRDLDPIRLFDPSTGEANIAVYPFNPDCNSCGDPVQENATGYLMRYLQWMVQEVGIDGFRIDAAKHVHGEVLDYVDRAVYRANPRPLLDGSIPHVFSFSEAFTGDKQALLSHVKKNIDPADPGRIGANRDALDFSVFFALRDNLSSPGTQNAWFNIRAASLDDADDGIRNGSAGVLFVQSHDEHGPTELGNVSHAYMLMQPGNAVVYLNGHQFGNERDFPKSGRGDALGGVYGDALTDLVSIRNTHGRGSYIERWIDNEGILVFEREASTLTGLSNRGDNGFDQRTVQVAMASGTHLIELTGNSNNLQVDPHDDISSVLTVSENGTVDLRIPRVNNANGTRHGQSYVIYGLAAPQSENGLEIIGASNVLTGSLPEASNFENGRTRLSDLHIITDDTFQTRLLTNEVRLLGSDDLRDIYADGDHALLKLDGGIDINGNGNVDYVDPSNISYGFEAFTDKSSPLIGTNGIDGERGDGEFLQTIDATHLDEGIHFLEARAFRHRTDNGPSVFSDFKQSIYIDRLPPESEIASFHARVDGVNENRSLHIRSTDQTANSVHVFLDLPSGLTDESIIAMVQQGNGTTTQIDRDLFKQDLEDVTHGNHVVTVATFEITGNVNIQRYGGVFAETIYGAGLGDLNFDGTIDQTDVDLFKTLYVNRNDNFNPAADFNGDGLITYRDLVDYGDRLRQISSSDHTIASFNEFHATYFSALEDRFTIGVNESLELQSPGLLANDLDPGMESSLIVVTNNQLTGSLGSIATVTSDGRLTYTPNPSLHGLMLGQEQTETFGYQLTDGLGSISTAPIEITVQGVNTPPTISYLSDVVLLQDTGTQWIDLRELSSGDGTDQPITITAIATRPELTGSILLDIAQNSTSGTLQFTPAEGSYGYSSIVVSVEDGGLDNDLSTSADNGIVDRTFTVHVIDAHALSWNASGFKLHPGQSTGAFVPTDLSAADFDGNGVVDVLMESSTNGVIALWSGTDFNQAEPNAIIENIQQLSRTDIKDLDNDGDPDIVIYSSGENGVHWYRNLGNWIFEKSNLSQSESIQASYALTTDLELDGDLDLLTNATINSGTDTRIQLHANQGDPTNLFSSTLFDMAGLAGAPAVGDIDADGDVDIILTKPAENKLIWFENDGHLNFSTRDITPADNSGIPSMSSSPLLVDLNADGKLDIIVPTNQQNGLSILLNQGAGHFTTNMIEVFIPSGSLELSDIDADGDIDLVGVSHDGTEFGWLENDLNGGFIYHLFSKQITNATAVTVLNSGDGYPDLLFGTEIDSDLGTVSLLENRQTSADSLDILIDYRYDTGFFANHPERKEVMERAARTLETHIKDSLNEIVPSSPNTWSINFDNPATGQPTSIQDMTIEEDTVIIFVGASDVDGLGYGGPGGWSASGTQTWLDTISKRGQTGIGDVPSQTTDFAPWGGVVTFASNASWHSYMSPPDQGTNDLYSVAVHEIAHVLGMGISNSWMNLINSSGKFAGPRSVAEYGAPVPLFNDSAHWLEGIESQLIDTDSSQETAMDPNLTVGERKLFTKLDLASMEDVGWEISPGNHLPTLANIPDQHTLTSDVHIVSLNNISPGGGEKQNVRLTATTLDTTLIETLEIHRTPGSSRATLELKLSDNTIGTTSIVVTAEDAGSDNDFNTPYDNLTFRQAFNITTYANLNDAPTLDSISNKTIDEDAPVQTVELAGISAGTGESQPLRITATSSNPNLIADPNVSYTSPNTTGTLQFTPLPNQHGATTITVTLEDGGLDSDLATSDDNATITTTFEVTVSGEFKWHNYARPADVNNDRNISAVDALVVINHLNSHGSHLLPQSRPAGSMRLDVNRDGWVSPADAIFVINQLNSKAFDVALSVIPLDLNGNQITTTHVGATFYLSLVTEGLRQDNKGVFAAYADVFYPSSHLTVAGVASYLSPYVNGRSSNTEIDGVVDDWGAFAGLSETGSGRYIVSIIPIKATTPGEIILSTSPANNSPIRDVLLFGSEANTNFESIEYRASQLSILEESEGEGWLVDNRLVSLLSSNSQPDLVVIDDFFDRY